VPGNLERLLAEVLSVYLPPGEIAPAPDARQIPYTGLLDPPAVGPDDEETIAAVMRLLRSVAAASEPSSASSPPPRVVNAVLSGAELIMRWECLAGRSAEVPGLLPGFAYMATVFFLDSKLALERSDEVRALVEAAGHEAR
jgi:hypothetical protein